MWLLLLELLVAKDLVNIVKWKILPSIEAFAAAKAVAIVNNRSATVCALCLPGEVVADHKKHVFNDVTSFSNYLEKRDVE